jgi:hypothetical protein
MVKAGHIYRFFHRSGIGVARMTENSREERARRRTLSVIDGIIGIALIGIALTGFVLGVLFCCPMSLGFLMLMFPEQDRPDRPIDRIQFEDAEYMLICRTTLDGPIDLQLYECEQGNQESCLLGSVDVWGHNKPHDSKATR